MPSSSRLLAILPCACLVACVVGPAYERPPVALPTQFEQSLPPSGLASARDWWTRFDSAELNALMREAMAGNLDIAAALQRIAQARAEVQIAGAALWPRADGTSSVDRRFSDSSDDGDEGDGAAGGEDPDGEGMNGEGADDGTEGETVGGSSSGRSRTRYSTVLSVSYELDLWGGNRSARRAALSRLAASEFDRDAVVLTLQSDLAALYFDALATQERLRIAHRNLDIARHLLDLIRTRFTAGATSALEVAQQRNAVAAQEAAIPPLERQLRSDFYGLAILLGRIPQGFRISATELEALALPIAQMPIPSELLYRRPDIRRAEADLMAANADIGAARAAHFPALILDLSHAFSWAPAGGSSSLLSGAASLAFPIFQGGRIQGGVRLAEARHAELIASYRKAVLVALQETENAALGLRTNGERTRALEEAARSAREAYDVARKRYELGASDFLTLLDAQRTVLASEDALVQSNLDRHTAAVSLFKALGDAGGGSEKLAPAATPAQHQALKLTRSSPNTSSSKLRPGGPRR